MTPTPPSSPFDRFIADLHERGRSENTLRAYQLDWAKFSTWFTDANGEAITLGNLTALDVQDFVRWSIAEEFAPSTINRGLSVIKQFATWAEEAGHISPDLRLRIKRVKGARKQSLAPKSLGQKEVRRLLRELERSGTVRDNAMVLTMLYTGIRVGELVALRTADITLRPRSGSLAVRADTAKGAKARTLPIPKVARDALSAYLAQRDEDDDKHDLIFVGREGPLSTAGVAAMLKKYGRRAKIDGLTPHVLRHTFAYAYLKNNGNDLVGLADILGHTDLNTTQIYTKRRLSDLQDGVDHVRFS